MTRSRTGAAILGLIGLAAGVLAPSALARQEPASPPPSRDAIVGAARTVIERARYASFVTIDETGQPQARIVDPFAPDTGFTVWMATNAASRKVAQIRRNPKATLLYFDAASRGEVTLLGTAAPVSDPAEKARRWKDDWAGFYKDRNRGDDYLLVRFIASSLEISAPSLGMNNDPATWKPVVLKLR